MNFDEAVKFHGHACPGLAIGYRVARFVLQEIGERARDEELVAIVENNSCAVDGVQLYLGCTFGKGNLIFRDYGKQVYTFIIRPESEGLRIAVKWQPPAEDPETAASWERYRAGDRSPEVAAAVQNIKSRKMQAVLSAGDAELFEIRRVKVKTPEPARIFKSVACDKCGEKVMETRLRQAGDRKLCIPCSQETGERSQDKQGTENSIKG